MAKPSTKPPKPRSPKAEAADTATAPERLAELAAQAVELARVVAKNAAAPEAVLTELSHSADPATRRALVTNPATPLNVLHEIAKQFPEELLDNPALDVFLLENPTFFRDLPAPILRAVVKRDNCSAGVLAQAVKVDDEVVLLGICQNPTATPETVRALQASTSAAVREAASLHVAVAGAVDDWQDRLREAVAHVLTQTEPAQRLRGLPFLRLADQVASAGPESSAPAHPLFNEMVQDAARAYSDSAVLERLAGDKDQEVRRAVAEHPAMPVALLERLADDDDGNVCRAVAENPATPVAALKRLAGDTNEWVLCAVARNPATPVALRERILERLADDRGTNACSEAARNPATPVALLERLAERDDVRWVVARNPATPVALLERLASDEGIDVRCGVAENPATPVALLERLASDTEEMVLLRSVADNPATPVALLERLASDESILVRCTFAVNLTKSVALLERLAGDEDSEVRKHVAWNPATPVALLERLAGDEDMEVLESVAKHPATSAALRELISERLAGHLERRAGDTDEWVRRMVADNPAMPVALLERLAGDTDEWVRRAVAGNPATPVTLLERLAGDKDWEVRGNVAQNRATPVALLERLAADKSANVRETVTRNPAMPLAMLECLLHDPNESVRSATRSGLSKNELTFIPPPPLTPEERAAVEARLSQDAQQFTAAAVPSLVRLLALLSPWTPVPALAKYFRSTWWEERTAIAANPATPPATRAKLAEDGNAVVRAAARATLAASSPVA